LVLTYYITKTESDSVAIIFVEQMLLMQNEGAAHHNKSDIAVRCTFVVSLKSQSTNPSVAGQVFECAAPSTLKLFFLMFDSKIVVT
jgi:hypothetical protein